MQKIMVCIDEFKSVTNKDVMRTKANQEDILHVSFGPMTSVCT